MSFLLKICLTILKFNNFSSLPDDFMDIQPVVDRKKLFINFNSYLFGEFKNTERKKKNIGLVARIKWRNFSRNFGLSGYLN